MSGFKRHREWMIEAGLNPRQDRMMFLIHRKKIIDALLAIESLPENPESELETMLKVIDAALVCITSLGADPSSVWQIFMDFKFRQIQMGRSGDPRIALKRLLVQSGWRQN